MLESKLFYVLLGFVLSSAFTWFINWRRSIQEARDELIANLATLRCFKSFEVDGDQKDDPERRYFESYPNVMCSALKYRRLIPECQKPDLDRRWSYFKWGKLAESKRRQSMNLWGDLPLAPRDDIELDDRARHLASVVDEVDHF